MQQLPTTNHQLPTARKGFTLIEALVAAALGSMVLGILITTLYQVRGTTDVRERIARSRDAAEFLHELLWGDLASAVLPKYFPGIDEPDDSGRSLIRYEREYFSLLTTHNLAAAAQGQQEGPVLVVYRIQAAGESHALMRTEYRITTREDRTAVFEMLVLRSDFPMRFRYLTASGEWADEIAQQQHRSHSPPLAVAVRLAHDPEETMVTDWLYTSPAWRLAKEVRREASSRR